MTNHVLPRDVHSSLVPSWFTLFFNKGHPVVFEIH